MAQPKSFALCFLPFACCLFSPQLKAAIWPETLGVYHRTAAGPHATADPSLWKEYGLQDAEDATYEADGKQFTATAWRLQDSTGALGAFQWQRAAASRPSKLASLAAETADGVMLVHNNYLLSFAGYKPDGSELVALAEALKNVDGSPLPLLPGFLPADNLVANSERYIQGPVALEKFAPGVPPSTAAFHLGAEAQAARFTTPAGEMALVLFNYPTPQLAMQRIVEFGKIPNAVVKRSGPLVAVVLAPKNSDDAERLLALVRYNASLMLDERVPTRRDNIGDLIVNAFELIGILLAFATVAGLAFGGLRALRRKKGLEADAVITLHLADR